MSDIFYYIFKKRNGVCITAGSLRLNFRPVRMDRGFNVVLFALGVSSELMQALEGLVEK